MTEYKLTDESVQEVVQRELEILGRHIPEIDARLASELLRVTGKHFIVSSYVDNAMLVFRCIATRCQWSCLLRIAAPPERAAVVTAAPETKEPDAPQEEHARSSRSTGRKKRRS